MLHPEGVPHFEPFRLGRHSLGKRKGRCKVVLCLVWGIGFPLLGTVLGAGLVWLLRWDSAGLRRMFSGAAAGIMGAAGVFGLFLPGWKQSPWAVLGVALGIGFLMIPTRLMGRRSGHGWLVALAVILHNIPEGMAAGISFGGWLTGSGVFAGDALAVGLGIGLQNLPDGAMVALPLRQHGMSRGRAFMIGILSGLVEPLAAVCMLVWAKELAFLLPVLMGFAAGAMWYVVVRELIPAMELRKGSVSGGVCFLIGLVCMAAVL